MAVFGRGRRTGSLLAGRKHPFASVSVSKTSRGWDLSSHRRNAPNNPRDVGFAGHAAPAGFAVDKLGDTLF